MQRNGRFVPTKRKRLGRKNTSPNPNPNRKKANEEDMKDKKSCTALKKVAVILAAASVLLGIVSFVMPPRGMIDSSVIAFAGEVFAFASLFFGWEAVDRGIDAKITHGGTEIDLNNPDKKDE